MKRHGRHWGPPVHAGGPPMLDSIALIFARLTWVARRRLREITVPGAVLEFPMRMLLFRQTATNDGSKSQSATGYELPLWVGILGSRPLLELSVLPNDLGRDSSGRGTALRNKQ